jgi:hypothetical protein
MIKRPLSMHYKGIVHTLFGVVLFWVVLVCQLLLIKQSCALRFHDFGNAFTRHG